MLSANRLTGLAAIGLAKNTDNLFRAMRLAFHEYPSIGSKKYSHCKWGNYRRSRHKEYGGDWATETFAQSAAAHLRFIEDGTFGTYRVREQAIRLHLNPHFGRKRISEIKRADVQDFIRAKTPTLSAVYVRSVIIATLRAILQPYVADDRLPRNAASGSPAFQYPPSSKVRKKLNGSITTKESADGRTLIDGGRALTRDEVALLLTHSSPQYWPLLLTIVYTGMRLGEILAMQWEYLTEGDDGVGSYAVEYNVDKRGQL